MNIFEHQHQGMEIMKGLEEVAPPLENPTLLLRRPRPPTKRVLDPLSSPESNLSSHPRATSKSKKNERHHFSQDSHNRPTKDENPPTFALQPRRPKGPEFFPPGRIYRKIPLSTIGVLPDEIRLSDPENDFTLNDFQMQFGEDPPAPPLPISQGQISRENYLKLTGWFATNVPTQENVNTLNLEVDHQAQLGRVPRSQILIELQAMVKKVLRESDSDDTSLVSSPSPSGPPLIWPPPDPSDILFKSATARYFCGQARSDSPFDASHQPMISPAEAAIMESMLSGGSHLSLKAHFVDQLPPLNPLLYTLTSLNLSYNSFVEVPRKVMEIKSLIFLSMRNNPLKKIPSSIRRLKNLRFLCLSFCVLSELPAGLFELPNIVDLDISYNNLDSIHRDICKLRSLRKLNVEGNRLAGLPASALCLQLSHIILGNNLMDRLLWKENEKNQPQALVDLCCVNLRKSKQILPTHVEDVLQSHSCGICDECEESVFGRGLHIIRSVDHSHFRVKNLPFIFTVCSATCHSHLAKKPAKFWLKKK